MTLRTMWQAGLEHWHYSLAVAAGCGVVFGAASLLLSPVQALEGLLVLLMAIAIGYKPEIGLLILVAITGGLIDSSKLPILTMGRASLQVTDIILLYMIVLVLTKALLIREFKLVRTPLDLPLILFYVGVLLSVGTAIVIFAGDPSFVLKRLRPLTYYLAFFAVTNLIRERRQLVFLIKGLVGIGVLASVAMLVQVLVPAVHIVNGSTPELITAGQTFEGVARTFIWAEFLIYLMLLVTLSLLIVREKRGPSILIPVSLLILGLGLFLTFQRNYWLTTLSMFAFLFLLVSASERVRMAKLASIALVAFAFVLCVPGLAPDRYIQAAEDRLFRGMQLDTLAQDSSTQMRVLEMGYAVQSIVQHPALGIGLGSVYRPIIQDDIYLYPDNPSIGLRWYVHNSYVWVWLDTGLVGFVPFILTFVCFVARGLIKWRGIKDSALRAVALGLTLGVLGQAISNIVAPNFIQNWGLVVFPIAFGINEIIYRGELGNPTSSYPRAF